MIRPLDIFILLVLLVVGWIVVFQDAKNEDCQNITEIRYIYEMPEDVKLMRGEE